MTTKTRTRRQKTEYEKKLSWLRNNKTPRHILEVELKSEENYTRKILSISDELRIIRNTVLGVVYKNYKQMKRTKKYNSLVSELSSINKQISSLKQDNENYDKDLKKLFIDYHYTLYKWLNFNNNIWYPINTPLF